MPTYDVLEDPLDGEDPGLERCGAVLLAREVEQVGDDPLQPAGLAARGLEIAGSRLGIVRHVGHRQRVEVAAHRGQRRAQLVRDVGQHLAPDPIRRLQRVGALRKVGGHAIERGCQQGDLVVAGLVGAHAELAGADPIRGALETAEPTAHRDEDHRADQRGGGKEDEGAGQRQ